MQKPCKINQKSKRFALQKVFGFLGIEFNYISHKERFVSFFGAFLGIFSVYFISSFFIDEQSSVLITASMGASAVLLFSVPHGALAQPWSVFGGHVISAAVGVFVASSINDTLFAASLAVGLAVLAMHYTRSTHPPGGATALMAVIGGKSVHHLGYGFVFMPVMLNATILITAAIIYNYFFAWRRYPVFLCRSINKTPNRLISHENLQNAFKEFDSIVDISEDDIQKIFALALKDKVLSKK